MSDRALVRTSDAEQPDRRREGTRMDVDGVPGELDSRLQEVERLARVLGDAASAQTAQRLRRLLAAVAELRQEQPVAVPAQRAPQQP